MISQKITINMPYGLHARPASNLTELIRTTKSAVRLKTENKEASATSMLQVLSLGLSKGSRLEIIVEGDDEKEALAKIVSFFDEVEY